MLKFVKGCLIIVCFGWLSGFTFPQIEPEIDTLSSKMMDNSIRTVVLDAGHGGKDPGCTGVSGHKEKNVVLKIVLELGKKIKEEYPNVRVYYTRQTDVFVNLHERSAIANRNKANLFISVHCNSHPSSKFKGTETYTMGLHKSNDNLDVAKRENSVILQERDYKKTYKGFDPNSPLAHIMMANYQSAFMMNSLKLAQKRERKFKRHSDRNSYGVKQAGFLVLWETAMPSVLVEAGFMSNKSEEAYLATASGQKEVAASIFKAFQSYKEEIEN